MYTLAYQQKKLSKLTITMARLVSVASKGLLLLVCSKLLIKSEIALLAVALGVANFTVLFSGFDITRRFQHLASIRPNRKNVSTSIYLHVILSASAAALVSSLFYSDTMLGVFIAVYIISEAISQEVGRLCVIVNQQFMIAFINIIKSVPPFLAVLYLFFTDYVVQYSYVIYIITFSSLISAIFSITLLWKLNLRLQRVSFATLAKKLILAIKFGIFFFVSTLFAKALMTLDKSFVVSHVGEEIAATYVVWMAFLVVSIPLYEIMIGSWVLSKLYDLHHSKDREAFVSLVIRTITQTTALWALVLSGSYLGVEMFFSEYNTLSFFTVLSLGCFVLLYLYFQIFGIANQVVEERKGQLVSSIAGIILWLIYVLKTQSPILELFEIIVFGCISLFFVVVIRIYYLKQRLYK